MSPRDSVQPASAEPADFVTRLRAAGIVADWRKQDVLRLAPVPLYNRYRDVYDAVRALKRTKFGSQKYVYPRHVMTELRGFFEEGIADRLPSARILYWT